MVVGHFISLFQSLYFTLLSLFNTVAPLFTAFVIYCQICATIDRIQMPKFTSKYHSPTLLLLARTLSGIWNLDFGQMYSLLMHVDPMFVLF